MKTCRMCELRDTAEHDQTQLMGQTINSRDTISTAWRIIHPKKTRWLPTAHPNRATHDTNYSICDPPEGFSLPQQLIAKCGPTDDSNNCSTHACR